MSSVVIPPSVAAGVGRMWGTEGQRWLARLPDLVRALARDWALEPGPAFGSSHCWVSPVRRADGSMAVLKLGVPGHLDAEAAALEHFAGTGAVRLLARDTARGALLQERANPGTPATMLVPDRDGAATAALIGVADQLHRVAPAGCSLPDLSELGGAFSGYLGAHAGDRPLPRRLVERAAGLFEELCATTTGRMVLHGDLHHDNVLRSDRGEWLAVDPHGVAGDRGYEVGALLYNPDPGRRDDALLALVPDRVAQLADGLRLPLERVVAWGFVKAMLSEVWTVEDGGTPGSRALDVARLLQPYLP